MAPEAFAATSFDYPIAGGGTAGLVLANRLSEIPTLSVGVIEAGEDLTSDPKVTTPLYMFDMQGDPKYDWNMLSEPQVSSVTNLQAESSNVHQYSGSAEWTPSSPGSWQDAGWF